MVRRQRQMGVRDRSHGVHSAGSAALQGNTTNSLALESALSQFLQGREVVLYPTGWAAGYGGIQGLSLIQSPSPRDS